MVHVFTEHFRLSTNQPAIKKTEWRSDLANHTVAVMELRGALFA
jgi:hypothetical protein